MPSCQSPVLPASIKPVQQHFFVATEGEVPANNTAMRQQLLAQYIGAEMHVVMTVNASRWLSVQPLEFFRLRLYDIFEGSCKPRLIKCHCKAMRGQTPRDLLLMVLEARWATLLRVRRSEVQMKSRVNTLFASQFGSTLRIGHEHHRAYRGDCSDPKAIERSIRREAIAAPVISIYNHLGIAERHGLRSTHDADPFTIEGAIAFSNCYLLFQHIPVSF